MKDVSVTLENILLLSTNSIWENTLMLILVSRCFTLSRVFLIKALTSVQRSWKPAQIRTCCRHELQNKADGIIVEITGTKKQWFSDSVFYLLEPFYLLLQFGLPGAGLIFLQACARGAASFCFSLQLVQLQVLQLFPQIFDQLRHRKKTSQRSLKNWILVTVWLMAPSHLTAVCVVIFR